MTTRILLALVALSVLVEAQTPRTNVISGRRYPRIVVRGGIVVDGSGTPASGPKDIVIENDTIIDVVALDRVSLSRGGGRPQGDIEIDATGKYVLPGLIDAHAHIQDERGGIPQPLQYEFNIWLACGITTVRDVGSDTQKTLEWRTPQRRGRRSPRRGFSCIPCSAQPKTPDAARARVHEIQNMTADGIKFLGIHRDIMEAAEDEAHKLGLRIAHHVGRRRDQRLGRYQVRHHQHRALVRNPRCRARRWSPAFPGRLQLQQ